MFSCPTYEQSSGILAVDFMLQRTGGCDQQFVQ